MYLRTLYVVFFISLLSGAFAGTWLSFNDFKEDGVGEPYRRLTDLVYFCKNLQKRLAKRSAYYGERVIRAPQEHENMCRFLKRIPSLSPTASTN